MLARKRTAAVRLTSSVVLAAPMATARGRCIAVSGAVARGVGIAPSRHPVIAAPERRIELWARVEVRETGAGVCTRPRFGAEAIFAPWRALCQYCSAVVCVEGAVVVTLPRRIASATTVLIIANTVPVASGGGGARVLTSRTDKA